MDEKDEKKTSDAGFKDYLRVFHYVDKKGWFLNGVAFIAAIGAGTVLPLMDLVFGKFTTQFTNFALGKLSPEAYRAQVSKYSLYFIYLFVAKFGLTYIHSLFISVSAIRTTKELRKDFLQSLLRQEIAYFDSADPASVSIQTTTNGNNVNNGISEKLTLTIAGLSTFVAAFVVAFAVQWKLTLITLSIVPTILVVVTICVGIDTKNEDEILSIYNKAGHLAEEVFATMRTVHSFWLQPVMMKRYAAFIEEAKVVGMKKSPNYMIMFSTEFFCTYAGYALAFWQGVRMYSSGEITESGDVVTVVFAVILAATAMTTIAPQILILTKAFAAASELFRVIDRKSAIDSMSMEGKQPESFSGEIDIRGVHFAYPTRKEAKVLNDLTLHIPAGKTTALVGASGSGKSTIIGLLERWYDVDGGEMFLDGVEIKDLNVGWLRTNVRLVQQEPVLFSGTVFENISIGLLGTEHASLSKDQQLDLVKDACRAAYADEFIEKLPKGYETEIGERAIMLSGGQKQRLAIARSIISDPRVLLLDEATSALDTKAEKIVQKALSEVSKNRTTLVIAHRLSTIQTADNIAVMSKGSVIEQGRHEELLTANGAYARLVKAQDLGQSSRFPKEPEEEEHTEKATLVRTQTQMSTATGRNANVTKKEKMRYNLLQCLWLVFLEQREIWIPLLIVLIASVFGGLTFPAQAIIFARAMNAFQIEEPQRSKQGDLYALMFFVVALGCWIIYGTIGYFSNIVAQFTAKRYRNELFERTMTQDMDFFDKEENGTGAIVSRLSTYPTNILELIGFNIFLILINVVNVLASSILAIAVGWKLGLVVAFGALPALIFCGYLRVRLEFKLDDATADRFANSAATAAEATAAMRTVSSLNIEKHIMQKFDGALSHVAEKSLKSLLWTMFWYALTQSISMLAMALGFWYGGQLVSTGEYSNEQFFIAFIGVLFSGEAAAAFFSYTTNITKAQVAINYVLAFRKQIPRIAEDPSQAPKSNEKDDHDPVHMECDALTFAYTTRPNAKVIQDVTIDIQAGKFVAFVGASGCGKSTMIALLERFYDPISGTISRNGTPLPSLCVRRYRGGIALVQQEPVLYEGSIRDNITMGLEGAEGTEEQIEDACRQANIFDFVTSLPDGLNTLCGARGTQLSGGQRQRIAIARALIRQPRLLLLDEATSALDTESEKIVQQALEKVQSGRTTVAVAHRLTTIKDADSIVVFERGRIAEMGTHNELLKKRGVYYEMCLGQSLDQAVD